MNLIKEIEIATQTFIQMKSALCEQFKGPHDLAPMLHFRYQHLKGYCGVLLGPGHPTDTIPGAWLHILKDGIPEFVMVMTEGYARTSKTMPTNHQRGMMEEDFKNNPESDVVEILNIHGIDMNSGDQASGIVMFRYDDNGMPTFDEPAFSPCDGQALDANIPRLFTACRMATLALHKQVI